MQAIANGITYDSLGALHEATRQYVDDSWMDMAEHYM